MRRSTVSQFQDEDPPVLEHNQMCVEHPEEMVIGYNKLTYDYLCGKCVSSQKLQREYYQIYPIMINRIAERIESTRKMIKFQRTQLEQTAKHIKKISKENREELT